MDKQRTYLGSEPLVPKVSAELVGEVVVKLRRNRYHARPRPLGLVLRKPVRVLLRVYPPRACNEEKGLLNRPWANDMCVLARGVTDLILQALELKWSIRGLLDLVLALLTHGVVARSKRGT